MRTIERGGTTGASLRPPIDRSNARWGLALGPKPDVAGAIYYDLGLIEESTGSRDDARAYYEKSLEVRPGNAIVPKALAAVSDAPPASAPAEGAPAGAKPLGTTIDSPF